MMGNLLSLSRAVELRMSLDHKLTNIHTSLVFRMPVTRFVQASPFYLSKALTDVFIESPK